MAFGLSPKYDVDIPLDNLNREEFLVIALEAAKRLGWNIGQIYESGFVAFTSISLSSWSEEISVKIENEIANLKSECTGNQIADLGKNKKNIENLVTEISELKNNYSPVELLQKYEELKPSLVTIEGDLQAEEPPSTKKGLTGLLAIFKPTEGYFITPILINLNILIFILMVISGVNFLLPDNESMIKWGANFRPVTLEGEWWRLMTSCFLHFGVIHLLMNMYALLYIGLLLEPRLGKTRFLAAYLLTGLSASVTSLWWHDLTISAGASGAIFGMYGVFLAMLTTNLIEKATRKALLTSIAIFVGYNLLNGLKGGIDNAAHIGGLAGGIVIGYIYLTSLKKPDVINLKYSTIVFPAVLILALSFVVYFKVPNDIGQYDKKIKTFAIMEANALEFYKLPRNTPKDKLLSEIKDKGIYYWTQNIKLLNDLEKLKLPVQIHERDEMLLEYCDLRIKSYNLIYKAIEEDNNMYEDSIRYYNSQIESIIKQLKAQ